MDINISANSTPVYVSLYTTVPQWTKIVQILIMVLVAALGIPGNFLIVVVQAKLREKSSTDYLVLGMAVVDLCGSAFVTSIYIALNLETLWITTAPNFVCQVNYFLVYWVNVSSAFLFAALAFDRYMRTCRPLCLRYSSKKAIVICVGSLFVGLCLASMAFPLFALNEHRICCKRNTQQTLNIIMNSFLTAAFALLFLTVLFCYTNIIIRVRERHQDKMRIQKELLEASEQTHNGKEHRRNKVAPTRHPKHADGHMIETVTTGRSLVIKNLQYNTDQDYSAPCRRDFTGEAGTSAEYTDRPKTKLTPFFEEVLGIKSQILSSTFVSNTSKRDASLHFLATNEAIKCFEKLAHGQRASQNILNESVFNPTYMPVEFHSSKRLSITGNITSSIFQRVYSDDTMRNVEKEQRKVNYVTLMMFLITLIYILTWVVHWMLYAIVDQTTETGVVVIYLAKTSFVLNYVSNALFYVSMSSKFRATARSMLCKLF